MPRGGRMWSKEERRVLMNAPKGADACDGGLICSVIRRHMACAVIERYPYRPGEPCRAVSHMVFPLTKACQCGRPWPCLHAQAMERADPQREAPRYASVGDRCYAP